MEHRKFRNLYEGSNRFIAAGLVASAGASICCLGPFALLATGVSGAWMSRLMMLEPYQPLLIALSLVAFVIAGSKLFLSPTLAFEESCCQENKADWKQVALFVSSFVVALLFVTSEHWIVRFA